MEIQSLREEFATTAKAVAPERATAFKLCKEDIPEEVRQAMESMGENADKLLASIEEQVRRAAACAPRGA